MSPPFRARSCPSSTARRPIRAQRPPRGPATCRSPHSPRSWRTASTSRNMPYCPGCVYERPPPLVFVGNEPPGPSLPSSTNAPPSPFAQKPRSSSVQQHGDRERVVDHEQVDVGRLDAGHREGARARHRAGGRGEVGHLADHAVRRRTSPRRARTTGGFGAGRAPARADVITTAPPPSVTRQQSSRCSGETCIGDASTSSIVIGSRIARAAGSCAAQRRVCRRRSARAARRWCRTRPCAGSRRARTRPIGMRRPYGSSHSSIGFGPGIGPLEAAAAAAGGRSPRGVAA